MSHDEEQEFWGPGGELVDLVKNSEPDRMVIARALHEWLGERRRRPAVVSATANPSDWPKLAGRDDRYESSWEAKQFERELCRVVLLLVELLRVGR